MAQTCIVCLSELDAIETGSALKQEPDDLDNLHTLPTEHTALASKGKEPTQQPTLDAEDTLLAHLLPCGHNLHNECLKPWVERANSCPICRASFNKVELYTTIGGPVQSTYDVADKRQEPILDPGLLVDPDETHQGPCMICEEYNNGRESELLCCDGCNNTCHPFCAGLDRIPRGPYYCSDCMEDPATIFRTRGRNTAQVRNTRHRRRRQSDEQEWARVWQSIRSNTGIDLDFPFETPDEEQLNAARRARDDLEQRARIAAEQGAGERFRRAAETLLESRAQRHRVHVKPEPESQEEIRAWNAFEKAKMAARPGEGTTPNRRKRKSPSASPVEEATPAEPERTLKRPRTRKTQPTGEASTAPPAIGPANGPANGEEPTPVPVAGPSHSHFEPLVNGSLQADNATAPAPTTNGITLQVATDDLHTLTNNAQPANGAQPSFLQSLLKEVETNASADEGPPNQIELAPFVDRASSPQSPQLSSPGASPPLSAQATPRAGTPPPLTLARESPPLASSIVPIYPAAPEFPPFSPADPDNNERKNRHNRPSHRSPETSPHRSHDASPTRASMSYSTKSEIQRMVTAVLKPRYRNQELTKDEYTDINRDVSRLLYDKVGDAAGLTEASTRERWQKLAEDEVETAIKERRTQPITPTAEPAAATLNGT